MKHKVVFAGLIGLSQLASAADLSGQVRDGAGLPIAGATIEVVGANVSATSDQQGNFTIKHLSHHHHELHIKAPGYVHRIFHIDHDNLDLDVTLDESALEIVNVIGLPWHASNIESAQPITVISGENLRSKQASTLGDTLKNEVGVHSSYYGPVASSPIIRGLEGSRVLISQNGLDAGDASRVGPDHAVTTEASTAKQIEILRGPATLFYGSGAIGGVVNIVDDRVPQSSDVRGEWRTEYHSVSDDKLVTAAATGGSETIALHADGFWRESNDYKIPSHNERLAASNTQAKGVNLGASYLMNEGFVGFSVGRLERNYGIPGHTHGSGGHDDHDHDHDHENNEIPVYADLTQTRYQLISELMLDNAVINSLHIRAGYTDYSHHEIELDQVATSFTNKSREARVDIYHHPWLDWRGALTLHFKSSDFSAEGLEAFTPPSKTETWALALIEERHFGDVLVQLGARVEDTRIDSFLNTTKVHLDDHGHGHTDDGELLSPYRYESNPYSLSAGMVWEFTQGYNFAVSMTHAERAPAASEIFSYGAHLGSGLFEAGALFGIESDDHGHIILEAQDRDITLEKSNNIDISLRKFNGDLGFITNIFYNDISDYYYLARTEFNYHSEHDHGDHQDATDLPLYIYEAQDAHLYGFESEWFWQVNADTRVTLMGDYIRGKLKAGGDLPRIPPLRMGLKVNHEWNKLAWEASLSRYFTQNNTADYEASTPGYTLLDMQLTFDTSDWVSGTSLYLKGHNLTDETAFVHSSFLRDKAPLPSRGFTLGVSGNF